MQSKHSVSAIVQMVAISKDHRVKVDKELDAKGPKIPKSQNPLFWPLPGLCLLEL